MPEKITLHENCVLISNSHDFAVVADVREHGDPLIDAVVLIAGQRCFSGAKSLSNGNQRIVFDELIAEYSDTVGINGAVDGLELVMG